MDLKNELEKRIKRRDDLKGKYDQLLGKKSQLESALDSLKRECIDLGIDPDHLESEITRMAEDLKSSLSILDSDLDSLEKDLSKY